MLVLVEDDHYKSEQILKIIRNSSYKDDDIQIFDNVKDAVVFCKNIIPDKLILDMSLPSHKALPGQGTPLPLPTGGFEILFELKSRNLMDISILILTQYPEIEVEDEPIPVSESAEVIKDEYGFTELYACYYDKDNSENWNEETFRFLIK